MPRNKSIRPLFVLALVCLLLLTTQTGATAALFPSAANVVATAMAAKDVPAQAVPAQAQQLSTPELIELAYTNGEISADQRLLYLAYALYDHASLPPQFQSNVGWSGTHYVAEVQAGLNLATLGGASVMQAEILRVSALAASVCDNPDGANSQESTNFYLNYETIAGGLDAQKYLDSLERAFTVEVTNYGWDKPPVCTEGTGSCMATNPWNKYPVQAVDLGSGLYGYVTNGGSYAGSVGDNPNTGATETAATASCMVLNDDYSKITGLSAQDNLDVTTAHEFVHSIQVGLGDPGGREDKMWYESIAAYMEDEVIDTVNNNYQFLWPSFDSCLGQYSSYNVYSNWLFFRYAAEKNGGVNVAGGGENIAQSFWTNVAAGKEGLGAYGEALAAVGANLSDTFHNFAITSRFNRTCPQDGPYCYEEAAGYVDQAGNVSSTGSIAAVGGSYEGSLQDNYAINWVDLPKEGIYPLIFENKSAGGEFRISIVADTGSQLQVTAFPSIVAGNNIVTLADYEPPAGSNSVVAVITNQHKTADNPSSCTSNPYRVMTAPNQLPVADAGGPYAALEGSPVVFDASGSYDPDGSELVYEWSFGDGLIGAGQTVTHTFADNGSYSVVLKVIDSAGASDVKSVIIPISNALPTTVASADQALPLGAAATVTAIFSDKGVDSLTAGTTEDFVAAITWGDGNTETLSISESAPAGVSRGTVQASHTYTATGTYSAQVCVTDDDEGEGCDSVMIFVRTAAPLNGALTQTAVKQSYDVTPLGDAAQGVITLDSTFSNKTTSSFVNVAFRVTTLTGDAILLNGDGGPGSVGSVLSLPAAALGVNGTLDPGESFTVQFQIGLRTLEDAQLMVSAVGTNVDAAPAFDPNTGLVGDDFAYVLSPMAQRIFLPAIARP